MKKAVAAVFHHCNEAPTKDMQHAFCPRSSDSWWKYPSDVITVEFKYKDNKVLLPKAVADEIKPIIFYKDLGSDEFLSKCLHGKTQKTQMSHLTI